MYVLRLLCSNAAVLAVYTYYCVYSACAPMLPLLLLFAVAVLGRVFKKVFSTSSTLCLCYVTTLAQLQYHTLTL
mgnify:CR=1 FL=1